MLTASEPPLPGAPAAEALTGTLERVVFANPETGWAVARVLADGVREAVTAVGNLGGAQPGERLRLTGAWVSDPRYGRQFRVEGYATLRPATLDGIERYLGSGLVRGVGPKVAGRLVARFGLATLDVIEGTPERLTEVEGIGRVRAGRIAEAWAEQKGIREVMVFLQGHGVTPGLAARIWRQYGTSALAAVRGNPYRLTEEVRGVGFVTADRIAARLGMRTDAPERLRAGILYTLGQMAERGHVLARRDALCEITARDLTSARGRDATGAGARPGEPPAGGIAVQAVAAALDGLTADGSLVAEADAIMLPQLAAAEQAVAARLAELRTTGVSALVTDLAGEVAAYETRAGITLAPPQRQAVAMAMREPVLIITGGPGTGKTTLLRAIVDIQARRGLRVALCAPTGRAAQRLGEAAGLPARTIHRLLGYDPQRGAFVHDAANPLPADTLVVDEVSMVDTVLMAHLLRALPARMRVVLVGDADQLPAVGPGNVLADLIASGVVPVVRLTLVFRQAGDSRIVTNAHRVNRGEFPLSTGGRDDFFWIRRERPEDVLALLKEMVGQRIPRRFGMSAPDQVQVLTPMRRGLLGADNLNVELQDLLNPGGEPVTRGAPGTGGRPGLRVGDKVMQLSNDYGRDVWNGDIGRIAGVDPEEGRLIVRFGGREVAYDRGDLDEIDLAYACSIHKAQGSEYPAVVIPLHTQHYLMLRRDLLYTALTRGRRLVVVIGNRRALSIALASRRAEPRQTLLTERLRAALPLAGSGGRASEAGSPAG